MKKVKSLIFKIFISMGILGSVCLSNQNDWFWQNPLPQGNELNSVFVLNNSHIWACGEIGTILKSSDNGVNWIIQNTNTNITFESIKFADENTGYAVGGLYGRGKIYKSNNSGETWNLIYESNQPHFYDVAVIDSSFLYATGNSNIILKSIDGGLSWDTLTCNQDGYIKSVFFLNGDTGYIAGGDGNIFFTNDGGLNWTLQNSGSNSTIMSIYFTSNDTGYAVTYKGEFLRTFDSGLNWQLIDLNIYQNLESVYFLNSQNGFLSGTEGLLMSTNDGGDSWNTLMTNTSHSLNSINIKNDLYGFIVGDNGETMMSSDLGINWTSLSSLDADQLHSLCFVNENIGYAVGENGNIIKTTNAGDSWSIIRENTNEYLYSVFFVDVDTGFVVGSNYQTSQGLVLKTVDGGNNWIQQNHQYLFTKVFYLNENIWYAVGGGAFKSSDQGITWSVLNVSNYLQLRSIFFIDENVGYVVGKDGAIFKTINGGNSWIKQQSQPGAVNALWDVFFLDDNRGFAVGDAIITKTIDGGNNWSAQYFATGQYFRKVQYLNDSTGFACGLNGTIFKTIDAGNKWNQQNSRTQNDLLGAYFFNEYTGYAVGENGTILKTDSSEVNSISENNLPKNTKFYLMQNYPNPFNPSTTISYSLSKNGLVELKVYDVLGREVSSLVNKEQPIGNYKVEFSGSNLTSGIYFYRLQSGGFTETKKLILLR